jgi:hypothetical protein
MKLFGLLAFRSRSSLAVYVLLGAAAFFGFLIFQDSTVGTASPQIASAASTQEGEALAAVYCQSCHVLPDPAWLDSKTWEHGVMPAMGPRLGIFSHRGVDYPNLRKDPRVAPAFYPTQPWLDEAQWQKIIDYYVGRSPASLPGQDRKHPIEMSLPQFAVEFPPTKFPEPATSFVRILEGNPLRGLIVSDVLREQTYLLDEKLAKLAAAPMSGSIVNLDVHEDGTLLACDIGQMDPNVGREGKAQFLRLGSANVLSAGPGNLFEDLRRPVQVTGADLNDDGRRDYLVCEFGHLEGGLSWMEARRNGTFLRHDLSPLPGAVKAHLHDYNGDGKPDIWALFSQGDESIVLFTNKGRGVFQQKTVLRFPSVYGSSYFELADFNHDGHPDVVHACGDNGDFTNILKPYHGVYVYLNDGSNGFAQQAFFPINGCNKAVARDFDGDGDLDIAATSFFADYQKQPEEGFVYLQNMGGLDFRPFSLEDGKRGRWLTMDAGDIDGDGDQDLVLGNCSMLPSTLKSAYNWSAAPSILLLRNSATRAN